MLALFGAACGANNAPDHVSEWLRVLNRKKAAAAPNSTQFKKQMYADSLAAFVARNPEHSRARRQSHSTATDSYRPARPDPEVGAVFEEALRGLAASLDRLTVSRQKLLALEKGMSQRDVAHLLGKPIPGWTARTKRPDCTIEAWYYRTKDRGVAGVYFRDGTLFAAEENSHAKLVPLTQPAAR